MAREIDKRIMLDLIIEAKKTDPETGPFSEWLAEYLVDHLPTLTQPNEPLTLEELREMDGEAIYWPKNKMWLIVYLNRPDFGDCAVNRDGQYLKLEQCEKRKVYRRPPEGEEEP